MSFEHAETSVSQSLGENASTCIGRSERSEQTPTDTVRSHSDNICRRLADFSGL